MQELSTRLQTIASQLLPIQDNSGRNALHLACCCEARGLQSPAMPHVLPHEHDARRILLFAAVLPVMASYQHRHAAVCFRSACLRSVSVLGVPNRCPWKACCLLVRVSQKMNILGTPFAMQQHDFQMLVTVHQRLPCCCASAISNVPNMFALVT